MKPYFDLIIVVPVGPGTQMSFLRDTIDSCHHYTKASCQIVVADNSHEGIGELLGRFYSGIDVVIIDKPSDSMGLLYLTLSHIYSYVLGAYHFKLLLKLDTDALLTGPEPEKAALELFENRPLMAMAGQYPLDYDGKPWDAAWPADRIINATMTWKFLARPRANLVLRKIYLAALGNGYRVGESVFGGSYFLSRKFLEEIQREGFLPKAILSTVRLAEDHIFSLLAKYVGMELGDLSGKIQGFACAWKGLPASPEALWVQGKKIIHSTRKWGELDEEDIRRFFREKRLTEKREGSELPELHSAQE